MKGYRPEDDSSLQEEGHGRQGAKIFQRDFLDLFYIPFYPLRSLGMGVDEFFNNPFKVTSRGNVDVRKPLDAVEDKDALLLRVDMPGLGKDDVRVYAKENSLVIKGEAHYDVDLDSKSTVEYAPYQGVPDTSKKHPPEGTIDKDPKYLEFLEMIAKPVENLPSAEIQLETKEVERPGAQKDDMVVIPLMEFVR